MKPLLFLIYSCIIWGITHNVSPKEEETNEERADKAEIESITYLAAELMKPDPARETLNACEQGDLLRNLENSKYQSGLKIEREKGTRFMRLLPKVR